MVGNKGCRRWIAVVATSALWVAGGCGGSPTSSSVGTAREGIRLNGNFTSGGGQGFSQTAYSQNAYEGITVHVMEAEAIQTTVDSNGSFTLNGLPEGKFTLVFMKNGVTLGDHEFDSVLPNSEITVVVELVGGGVRVRSQKRTGIGHGDVEIEGLVESVTPDENKLVVNGYTVFVEPGVTVIREGNRARTIEDIRDDNRVHVKGVGQDSSVLAREIKLQNDDDNDDDDDDDDGDDDDTTDCPNGGKIDHKIVLEGYVISGDTENFHMRATGRTEDIEVLFDGTPTCVGQARKSEKCEIIREGDKVNVKGTLETCSLIAADEVKIQKKGPLE